MLLAELKPRIVAYKRPSNDEQPAVIIVEFDCPCGWCSCPYKLFDVPGLPSEVPAEQPDFDWWTKTLAAYSSPGDVCRVIPSVGCRWAGVIKEGQILEFDGRVFEARKSKAATEIVAEVTAREEQRQQERKRNGGGVRGR